MRTWRGGSRRRVGAMRWCRGSREAWLRARADGAGGSRRVVVMVAGPRRPRHRGLALGHGARMGRLLGAWGLGSHGFARSRDRSPGGEALQRGGAVGNPVSRAAPILPVRGPRPTPGEKRGPTPDHPLPRDARRGHGGDGARAIPTIPGITMNVREDVWTASGARQAPVGSLRCLSIALTNRSLHPLARRLGKHPRVWVKGAENREF